MKGILLSDRAGDVGVNVPDDWRTKTEAALIHCCGEQKDNESSYVMACLKPICHEIIWQECLVIKWCEIRESKKRQAGVNKWAIATLTKLFGWTIGDIYGPVLCFGINTEPDSNCEPFDLTVEQFQTIVDTAEKRRH